MKQKKTTQTFRRHATGKVQQPMTTERCYIKKTEKKQYKVKIHPTGNVQQPKTTQRYRTEKMEKKTAQRQVSHTPGSTTENNRIVSHREDRKETTQGQVSQSQSSTTEENKKIANKEDRKQTAQGQVCLRGKVPQRNTTEWYRTEKIENKQQNK